MSGIHFGKISKTTYRLGEFNIIIDNILCRLVEIYMDKYMTTAFLIFRGLGLSLQLVLTGRVENISWTQFMQI